MALSKLSTDVVYRADKYKYGMWRTNPPGGQKAHSHILSRGGMFKTVIPFGISYLIQEYLVGVRVTHEQVLRSQRRINESMGPNVFDIDMWMEVIEKHGGKLPVRILALDEGTKTEQNVPWMTIENTGSPKTLPLVSHLETLLVSGQWSGTSVASMQYAKRQMMQQFIDLSGTGTPDYKWHDFGYRAASSQESAALNGAAHLLSFNGGDTSIADEFIEEYYDGPEWSCGSIPGTEHSNITPWGREREGDAYANLLRAYNSGPLACVSDSYDIFNACKELWGTRLRNQVLARDGFLVVRPDSGDPQGVSVAVLEILADKFGYEVNDKGYKVLHPKVRVLQGDGINYSSAYDLLRHITNKHWSVDNLTLGEGTGIHTYCNRDTLKIANKQDSMEIDNVWVDVFKDPITDPGKSSFHGRMAVQYINDQWKVVPLLDDWGANLHKKVFENGEQFNKPKWSEIKARVLED